MKLPPIHPSANVGDLRKTQTHRKQTTTFPVQKQPRRETQKRIRRNKKKADQLEGQAKRYRQVVREQKKAAANVENAINGKKSRVIDQGTIGSLPKSVRDLVNDSTRWYLSPTMALSLISSRLQSKMSSMEVRLGVGSHSRFLLILYVIVIILIFAPFAFAAH